MHVCKVWWDSEVNNVWVKVKVCCRSGMLVIRHSDSGRYADALMATGSRPKLVTETWVACRSRRWAVRPAQLYVEWVHRTASSLRCTNCLFF